MSTIIISIYDSCHYDLWNIAELYQSLSKQLNEIDKNDINNQHRILTRMILETENEIVNYREKLQVKLNDKAKIEELINSFDINFVEDKEYLETINNKYGLIKGNIQSCEFAIDVYIRCYDLIQSRLDFLMPYVHKQNLTKAEYILAKSDSKFILKSKKIYFDTIFERVFELFFVLNAYKTFNKEFNNKEIKNFSSNYLRKYGTSDKISGSTVSNILSKCNKESKYYFNFREFEENDNFGHIGEKNFANYFTKTDIFNFIEFVNLLFPTDI